MSATEARDIIGKIASYDTNRVPTDQYAHLQAAFDFFNGRLFGGRLPATMITMQRKRGARGFFRKDGFSQKDGNAVAHEIALNPDTLSRTDKGALSTLVHEMVHLEQQEFGKPGRGAYHNREWAELMEAVGLIASDTGSPGGKKTGQRVSHYIVDGGSFDKACDEFLATGFVLRWQGNPTPPQTKPRDQSKVKFICPDCAQNAWAKATSSLVCGDCHVGMAAAE